MRDLILKIVGGAVAGVIVWFVTQFFLSKDKTTEANLIPSIENIQLQDSSIDYATEQATLTKESKTESEPIEFKNVLPHGEVKSEGSTKDEKVEVEESSSDKPKTKPDAKISVDEDLKIVIQEGRDKTDTLIKDVKVKEEVKKVRKRADDVFDELDRETKLDTIPENRIKK